MTNSYIQICVNRNVLTVDGTEFMNVFYTYLVFFKKQKVLFLFSAKPSFLISCLFLNPLHLDFYS